MTDHSPKFAHIAVLAILLVGLPVVAFAARTTVKTDTKAAPKIAGDVKNDGMVSLDDAVEIRRLIETGQYSKRADLNADGIVDQQDLQIFYEYLSLKR